MKYQFVAAVVVLAALGCGVAQAGQVRTGSSHARVVFDHGMTTKPFTVATTDLQTPQGAQDAYNRLVDVAEQVCEVDGAAPDWVLAQDRECVADAVNGAIADLHSEPLRQVAVAAARDPQALTYASDDR